MNNFFQIKQLFRLISAMFFEMVREPGVLFWGIGFPILMSLGLGVAFTNTSDTTRKIALVESVQWGDSASVINKLIILNSTKTQVEGSKQGYKMVIPDNKLGNTTFIFSKENWQQAMILLKRGNVSVVITEKNNQLVYNLDPANPDAQLTYIKLQSLLSVNKEKQKENNQFVKPLTVKGTRYIDFLVPGLIAMGIMMSCMWGISYGIIEKRSKKLLRRLVATPMKKSHFLIAMITVRLGMNFIEGFLLVVFAYYVFDFTIQGSVPALFLILIAGNIAFSGIAVFISSRTAKTEIGNAFINVVNMPMMILSGIFFSYHNFPDWTIPIIEKFPLTMMTDDMRSVFIEGAGISDVLYHALILATTGVVFFVAGLKIFKWH